MSITELPSPPSTNDPANFATKADALLASLPAFVTEVNATAAAMNLNATTDTSASSVAIGTGAKSFTASTGKSFQPGMWLVVADTAAPSTNQMYGTVTSYDTATGALVMNIVSVRGSGTKTAWVISQSAPGGAAVGANSDITSLTALAAGGLPDNSVLTADIADAQITDAKLATAVKPLGVGQTRQNVTGSRTYGVNYTNSTGRIIEVRIAVVMASSNNPNLNIGSFVQYGSYAAAANISIISALILPGEVYNLSGTSITSISSWWEIR